MHGRDITYYYRSIYSDFFSDLVTFINRKINNLKEL